MCWSCSPGLHSGTLCSSWNGVDAIDATRAGAGRSSGFPALGGDAERTEIFTSGAPSSNGNAPGLALGTDIRKRHGAPGLLVLLGAQGAVGAWGALKRSLSQVGCGCSHTHAMCLHTPRQNLRLLHANSLTGIASSQHCMRASAGRSAQAVLPSLVWGGWQVCNEAGGQPWHSYMCMLSPQQDPD